MLSLPFLSRAFFLMDLKPDPDMITIATNGAEIRYNPVYLLRMTKKEPNYPGRVFLHMILHCVYQHPFDYNGRIQEYWDEAADIAVENMILSLGIPDLSLSTDGKLRDFLSEFRKEVTLLNAERIYSYLLHHPEARMNVRNASPYYTLDNHTAWIVAVEEHDTIERSSTKRGTNALGDDGRHEADQDENATEEAKEGLVGRREKWNHISELAQTDLTAYNSDPDDASGAVSLNLAAVLRSHRSYSDFLKRFKVLGEEMHIDDNSFDYIYYTYGLDHYGNMPLIEPLEYRETDRISDFVIAIDTSGSCQGDVVKSFLEKTYQILKSSNDFFETVNIHIIQCDAKIQDDTIVRNDAEFDDYMRDIHLSGFGGTDFRPVFDYVNGLIRDHAFRNLKGLLYFTDGNGQYPASPPPYACAFVLPDDGDEPPKERVPDWAVLQRLKEDSF